MKQSKSISVGELAEMLRTTPRALRLWEDKGLLGIVERARNGSRIYSQSNIEAAVTVTAAIETGCSLDEAKVFVERWDSPSVRETLYLAIRSQIMFLELLRGTLPDPESDYEL